MKRLSLFEWFPNDNSFIYVFGLFNVPFELCPSAISESAGVGVLGGWILDQSNKRPKLRCGIIVDTLKMH
jgi:hypothetical protein